MHGGLLRLALKKTPRYTDEFDVIEIGKVVVKMPDTTGGLPAPPASGHALGRTEVEVRARDLSTGKETEAMLRIFPA